MNKRMSAVVALTLAALLLQPAFAEVRGEEVTYTSADGKTLRGYLAYDDAIDGPRPSILVVHEWWGHNEYARTRADMLAELGYTALAVDMFGDGKVAAHPKEAGEFAAEVYKTAGAAQARFLAAMEVLKAHPTVNPDEIAAIGYCFGGSVVLNMARQGVDLRGVASFHGALTTDTPAKPGVVTARVLVLHGGADSFIPPEQVAAFKQEMDSAGVDYQFIVYPDATHSFTSPEADDYAARFGMPIKYNPAADAQSWQAMQDFFDELFSE